MDKQSFKSISVLIVVCQMFSSTGIAQEPITGAFGMTLGSVYDHNSTIDIIGTTDGGQLYQFHPQNKFRSFSRYYIMITPKTDKIYSIWGIGDIVKPEVGKKEQAVLMSILENKYGDSEREELFDSSDNVKQIDQGNRFIIVKLSEENLNVDMEIINLFSSSKRELSDFSYVKIEIRYYDNALSQLAEKERIDEEASQKASQKAKFESEVEKEASQLDDSGL